MKNNPNKSSTRGGHRVGAGRKKGTPNKITQDVREAIKMLAERNVGDLEKWLKRVAKDDPAKAADIFLRAIEYHIPKLQRSEHTGPDGGPQKHEMTVRFE